MFLEFDTDGSGRLERNEILQCLQQLKLSNTKLTSRELNVIMSYIDEDGSGKITSQELKAAVIKVNPNLDDEDISAAMELFDKDHTGTITEKEFRQGIELMKTFG